MLDYSPFMTERQLLLIFEQNPVLGKVVIRLLNPLKNEYVGPSCPRSTVSVVLKWGMLACL